MGQLQPVGAEGDGKLVGRRIRSRDISSRADCGRPSRRRPVSQHDHAVDHELQKAVALVGIVSVDLLRDDAGQPRLAPASRGCDRSPAARRPDRRAARAARRSPSKTMRVALISLALACEHAEHADEIELARLDRLSGESRASRKKSFFLISACRSQPKVAALATICSRALLEGDEEAGLASLAGAVDQGLEREDGLAAARPAHDQASCARAAVHHR